MESRHTVAVVGAGAMGASAAWHLARRGHDVTVFERFERGHARGSSHGDARIFRLAHTDPWWTALARTAWDGWQDLQEQSGRELVGVVGGLDHGHPALVDEVEAACVQAGIPHERLDPAAATERWPGLTTDRAVVFHPGAGTTDAARTVATLLELAEHHGADIRPDAPVEALAVRGDHVEVRSLAGPAARFDRVVVAAGAWTSRLLAGPTSPRALTDGLDLRVTREHPVEFDVRDPGGPSNWPTCIHHDLGLAKPGGLDDTIRSYSLPTPSGRVKVGEHHVGHTSDPDRSASPDPVAVGRVRDYVAAWFPGLDPASARAESCLYTTTPTLDFVIDRVGPIAIAAGFSGHGFKYVPWVGATLADLVEGRPGPARFRLSRSDSRSATARPWPRTGRRG